MNIAIIGTQGLPARYGGFETLSENLIRYRKNGEICYTVYCSSFSYNEKIKTYNEAKLVYIPLKAQGIQSLLYDFISILHAINKYDKLLLLGVSGCFILPFLSAKNREKIIVNIDGLEHKRNKWGFLTKKILLSLEYFAIRFGRHTIADNVVIQEYVHKTYNKKSHLIEYGGDHALMPNKALKKNYYFTVCRIEPENNIHIILEAFSSITANIIIVGNWKANSYSKDLYKKYKDKVNIKLEDPIYDLSKLNEIRGSCKWYVHGHSAGGTNPSLVEAMNLELNVLCLNVNFNIETTEGKATYFKDANDLQLKILEIESGIIHENKLLMSEIANRRYTWRVIAEKYLKLFQAETNIL
jgi:glycosyltransferase involved in cell wall biosynthesis